VNRDGVLDLMTANIGTNTVSVLLGYGDGAFGEKLDLPAGKVPVHWLLLTSIAIVGSTWSWRTRREHDYHLLGNGDGTFRPKADFVTGAGPHAVALADLNGDEGVDVIVGNWLSGSVSVVLNTPRRTPSRRLEANRVPYLPLRGEVTAVPPCHDESKAGTRVGPQATPGRPARARGHVANPRPRFPVASGRGVR